MRIYNGGLLFGAGLTIAEILFDRFVADGLITSWRYTFELWTLYATASLMLLLSKFVKRKLRPWILGAGALPILALSMLMFLSTAYPVHLAAALGLLAGACLSVDERQAPTKGRGIRAE